MGKLSSYTTITSLSGSHYVPIFDSGANNYKITYSSLHSGIFPALTSGYYLSNNGASLVWGSVTADNLLPSQTSNSGKALFTNGSTSSWSGVTPFPNQSGQSGKVLSTNGGGLLWATSGTGGAGTPGGSSGQIQYNDGSAFAGSGAWYFSGTQLVTPKVGPNLSNYLYSAVVGDGSLDLKVNSADFVSFWRTGGRYLANYAAAIEDQVAGTTMTQIGLSNNNLYILSPANTFIPLKIQAATNQTANLTQWNDVNGNQISSIDKSGAFHPPTGVPDASGSTNSIYYSTTQSTLVYKETGGGINKLYDVSGYIYPVHYAWSFPSGSLTVSGDLTTRPYVMLPSQIVAVSITSNQGVSGSGSGLVFDINITGSGLASTSIWATNQQNRINLSSGLSTNIKYAFDTTTLATGNILSIDIDSTGNFTGQNIAIQLLTMARNINY